MSGQDFEVEVRFPNVGKKRNGVSDEGNLMRKSMDLWEKRPQARGRDG